MNKHKRQEWKWLKSAREKKEKMHGKAVVRAERKNERGESARQTKYSKKKWQSMSVEERLEIIANALGFLKQNGHKK